jgi:hypothetical protein
MSRWRKRIGPEAMTGVAIERAYHRTTATGTTTTRARPGWVMLSGRRRGLTPQMKREIKRRSAIEPMIGHAKNDGRLGRNQLKPSPRPPWRQDQRAVGRLRPQPAPHPQHTGASFCPDPGSPPRARRKTRYLAPTSRHPKINRLGVFQGRLLTLEPRAIPRPSNH